MEITVQYFIIVLITLGICASVIIVTKWLKLRSLAPDIVEKQQLLRDKYVNDLEEDIVYQEKKSNQWKGKYYNNRDKVQVEGNYDLSNDDGVASIIKQILPAITEILPAEVGKKLKGLLDNPEIVDAGLKLYKEHPEEIKSLLNAFVKKTRQTSGSNSKTVNSEITVFDKSGA